MIEREAEENAGESSSGSVLLFAESIPTQPKLPEASEVVALTASASRKLSQLDQSYSIPEDFLSLSSIKSVEEEYAARLSDWLDHLDSQLLKRFEGLAEAEIRPARSFGYYLKCLLDPFMVNALRLERIFEAVEPSRVILLATASRRRQADHQLYFKGPTPMQILLPHWCAVRGIPFEERSTGESGSRHRQSQLRTTLPLQARALGAEVVRAGRNLLRTHPRKEAVLIHSRSRWTRELERAARENGYRVIYATRRSSWNPTLRRAGLAEGINFNLEHLTQWTGLDCPEPVLARLAFFVEVVCPNLEEAVVRYWRSFERDRVRFTIIAGKSSFDDLALATAAFACPTTVSVQVTHGYSAFDNPEYHFTEKPCDIYLTVDSELCTYMRRKVFPEDLRVEVGASWTALYERQSLPRRRTRPRVLYVPTVGERRRIRIGGGTSYSETWYFRHQRRLLRGFLEMETFDFVWKEVGRDRTIWGEFVGRRLGRNVRVIAGPLADALRAADCVIVDYPSTPMYEAALLGKPTLVICHASLRLRDGVVRAWGKSLQRFERTDEALASIRTFLDGFDDSWIPEIREPGIDPWDPFEEPSNPPPGSRSRKSMDRRAR